MSPSIENLRPHFTHRCRTENGHAIALEQIVTGNGEHAHMREYFGQVRRTNIPKPTGTRTLRKAKRTALAYLCSLRTVLRRPSLQHAVQTNVKMCLGLWQQGCLSL